MVASMPVNVPARKFVLFLTLNLPSYFIVFTLALKASEEASNFSLT